MSKENPTPAENKKNLFIAVLAALPYAYAEYRRYGLGGRLDLTYWLLSAVIVISVYCLYRVLLPMTKAARARGDKAKIENAGTDALSYCLFIVAAYAFAVGYLVRFLY